MLKSPLICRPLFFLLLLFSISTYGCQTATPTVIPPKANPSTPQDAAAAAAAESAADKAFDELDPSSSSGAKPSQPAASSGQPPRPQGPDTDRQSGHSAVRSDPQELNVVRGSQNDWVTSTSQKYPATGYLTAVGSGTDRTQAEDNARAEMAKIFESHVEASTKVQQEYLEVVSKANTVRQSSRVDVADMIAVSTRKVLSGVRIAELYQQQKPTPLFYALAVLDRKQTLTILTQKLQAADIEIDTLITQASKTEKKLDRIKILTTAVEQHLLRQTHEAEMRVVDPAGRGLPAPVAFQEIKRQLNEILNQEFRIHVAISGDRADEVQKVLSQGLNQEGFVLTSDRKQANVAVEGKVTIQPLERPDEKWKYVRWQTAFELVDLRNRTVFGTLSNSGREGHLNRVQAANRAVMKIQKELLPVVSKDVHAYILGP